MLKIYNSRTQKKETFQPIHSPEVLLYVCGMTVYDYCHIGHARSMITFDVVVRFLRSCGYQVRYVRNITDIDDKIINRANENHETIQALTARFIEAMHEDFRALKLLPPDQEPKATEFIPTIIQLVQTLEQKGFAYLGTNGDVYFDVRKFKPYGKLSHRQLDELKVGARIEPTEGKKDPLDFVLWKSAKPDEPSWDSPWGKGRPGWHIECSAMSTSCLAPHVDIHGGGIDLLFPHHENEIAQSEAATGGIFANCWMHAGHLQVNKQKMSKSLHNFITIRDLLKKHHPEVIRYFMISGHYRGPINYSEEALSQAKLALEKFYLTLRDVPSSLASSKDQPVTDYEKRFTDAMNDDFNTPLTLAVLFEINHEIRCIQETDKKRAQMLSALLKKLGGILGLFQEESVTFLKYGTASKAEEIEKLIELRNVARKNKNWKEADQLREKLSSLGIVLEDRPDGTTLWRQIG